MIQWAKSGRNRVRPVDCRPAQRGVARRAEGRIVTDFAHPTRPFAVGFNPLEEPVSKRNPTSTRNTIPGFGAHLRSLRERATMTQQALADAAGTSPDSIVKLEGGSRFPSFDLAGRIADALKITVDALRPPRAPGAAKKKPANSAD